MIALSNAVRRRRRSAGEGGFALAGALAAMFLSALLVTALLSLTFATTAFSGSQLNRDDETRAADGAIQATIARLARDETARLGSLADTEYCAWTPSAGQTEADRPTMASEVNGEQVEVTCEAEAPDVYVPERVVTDVSQVVGEYRGAVRPAGSPGAEPPASPDLINAVNWKRTPAAGTECRITQDPHPNGCFPWREALNAADVAANHVGPPSIDGLLPELQGSTSVGISHTGVEPLRLIGDAQVKHGSAALRNSRDCVPNAAGACPYISEGPGISVSGQYVQGAKGLLAEPSNPTSCGVLAKPLPTEVRPFQVQGAQVVGQLGTACGSAGAASLDPDTAGLSAPTGFSWSPQQVRSSVPQQPRNGANVTQAWSASCPASNSTAARVVRFSPGAYTKDLTATLNRWFSNCTGFVFHFQPGDYWFDVDQPSAPYYRRSALVMANPANYYVFGVPRGWTSFANVGSAPQPLCDSTQRGVTITLSGRTSIVHRQGIANVCGVPPPNPATQPVPTVWQEPTPDIGTLQPLRRAQGGINYYELFRPSFFGEVWNWIWGGPVPGGNSFTDGLRNPTTNQLTNTLPFRLRAPCVGADPTCRATATFAVNFAPPTGTEIPDADISSAVLRIRASSAGVDVHASQTRIDVYHPSVPNSVACSAFGGGIPDNSTEGPGGRSYDLLNPGPAGMFSNCASVLKRRSDLFNSVFVVTMDLRRSLELENCHFPWTSCSYSVTVSGVDLQTAWSPRPVGGVTCQVSGQTRNTCMGRSNTQSVPADVNPAVLEPWGSSVRMLMERQCTTVRIWLFVWIDITTCLSTPGSGTGTLMMRNLDDRYNPDVATAPDATITTAGVFVQGNSVCNYNVVFTNLNCAFENDVAAAPGSHVRVRLMRNGVSQCTAAYRQLASFNDGRYLDLFAPTGGNVMDNTCRSWLTGKRNSDLLGLDLQMSFALVKRNAFNSFGSTNFCVDPFCNWWGYDVNEVTFSTTSGGTDPEDIAEAYQGPRTPMRVTSNNSPLSVLNGQPNPNYQHNASFTMFGPLSLPGNDLDVRWSGPASRLPIVSGFDINGENSMRTMIVRGLGSDTRPEVGTTTPVTGIVCCSDADPGERIVELRAWVGRQPGEPFDQSQLRAVAKVRIRDHVPEVADGEDDPPVGAPQPGTFQAGNRVRIEDWRVCTRGGAGLSCESV